MCLVEVSHLNLVFVGERPRLHTPLQQTNEQTLFKMKNLNLLTISFFAISLLNRGKSSCID